MLCINLILFAIVSCGARELESSLPALNDFTINAVELSTQKPNIESRIIGGTATSIEKYPYTVQVLYFMQLTCAGSLLTRRLVLSAGHCFVDQTGAVANPRAFAIRAGTSYLNSGGTVYYVSTIVVHERYDEPLRNNDVAVLLLSSSVTLSSTVQTARIPVAGARLADDSTVVVVGWGRTNADIAVASNVLNEVSVRTVNRTICTERYAWLENLTSDPYPVTDSMLCAGLLDVGGADACQGDSGGPLLYGDIVVGITSWGYGCAQPLLPGVYAKVSSYTTWINQTVSRYGFSGSPSIHSAFAAVFTPLVFLILSI